MGDSPFEYSCMLVKAVQLFVKVLTLVVVEQAGGFVMDDMALQLAILKMWIVQWEKTCRQA